ncbi:MAG: hypothetical protein ACRES4_01795 [Nevskiales bacterium]
MKKVLLGSALAAGLMATGIAQADTEDALLGGLVGVALGVSIANDHDHDRVARHYYEPRPVRHYYYAPPRHVRHQCDHHPRGHAHGYWRKYDQHHYRDHRRYSNYGRRDWDRRDRRWHDDD